MEKITNENIIEWIGEDAELLELVNYLRSLLNGELSIDQSRKEILQYSEDQTNIKERVKLLREYFNAHSEKEVKATDEPTEFMVFNRDLDLISENSFKNDKYYRGDL